MYTTGRGEKRVEKTEFPWEFTVPLTADVQEFRFTRNGHKPDGTVLAITSPAVLKRTASAAEDIEQLRRPGELHSQRGLVKATSAARRVCALL